MLTAYVISAVLMLIIFTMLRAATGGEDGWVWVDLLIILLASVLWPLTLLAMCGLLVQFWWNKRYWPK